MPRKKQKSGWAGNIADAHEKARDNETRVGGGGDLPPGITMGVAKLSAISVGVYKDGTQNEGEPFLRMAGVVVEPENVEIKDPKTGKVRYQRVQGMNTKFGPEPLCDTTTRNGNEIPVMDHWDRCLNTFRLLGIETKDQPADLFILENDDGTPALGPALEALLEAGPYFNFDTYQRKGSEYVNETWKRHIPDYDPDAAGVESVQDETEWEEPTKGTDAPEEEGATDAPEDAEPAEDWLEIAAKADKGTPKKVAAEAGEKLSEKAEEMAVEGHAEMDTWKEVAEAIIAATDGGSDEGEEYEEEEYSEEPEEWEPQEGETAMFTPPRSKEPVAVTVMKINAKTKKADVKRSDTNRITKGVPLDKLSAS